MLHLALPIVALAIVLVEITLALAITIAIVLALLAVELPLLLLPVLYFRVLLGYLLLAAPGAGVREERWRLRHWDPH
jgi:hypothetical protein